MSLVPWLFSGSSGWPVRLPLEQAVCLYGIDATLCVRDGDVLPLGQPPVLCKNGSGIDHPENGLLHEVARDDQDVLDKG